MFLDGVAKALACIADAGGAQQQQQQLLLVATCHIHWDPDYSDVKLIQTMMLMNELKNIVEDVTSSPSDVGTSSDSSDECRSCCADVPLILCGDFNSLPNSGELLLVMAALCKRAGHYIFAPWFLSSVYLLFFSLPNLSGRRLDVYHTLTHGVALVQIWNAGLKGAARGSLQMQNRKKSPKIAIWAPSTTLSGYIFATKACIDNRKRTC